LSLNANINQAKPMQKQPTWMAYLQAPEKLQQLYRRTLMVVVFSQILGGAGLAAGITVGALIAQDMLGTDSFAGVPSALFTFGSALAALIVGRLTQRHGRRFGLAAGFLTGGIGAIGVVIAAITSNIVLLFAALLIYGAGTATNLQARYAGTDLAKPKQRAKSISIAMVSTTFGAVAGPNLVEPMGRFAESVRAPALSGPFMLAAAAFILAGLVLLILLRPDPYVIAKAIANAEMSSDRGAAVNANVRAVTGRQRGVAVGATVMVLTQFIMVAIMTMTPLHMMHNGHGLGDVGMVIGIHVGAMYLPSLVTGVLVDKIGRTAIAIASGITLLAAGVLSATAPPDSFLLITIALALLGLGWNFGLISGTAILVDATSATTRAKTQGSVDVLISLAGASGGMLSGMIVASASYAALSLSGGILALALLPVVLWRHFKTKS